MPVITVSREEDTRQRQARQLHGLARMSNAKIRASVPVPITPAFVTRVNPLGTETEWMDGECHGKKKESVTEQR